jgi:clan AA aspartic protease
MNAEYKYEKTVFSDVLAPTITNFIIKNLLGSKQKSLSVLIDTGYDGFLVVPEEVYEDLGLDTFEIAEDEIPIVESFTGEKIPLRTANTLIEIKNLIKETIIEVDTTPYCKEPLIGRQLLELFITVLDGRKRILKLQFPTEDE